MTTLRRIFAATILSLMLAVSAFAGHIETPGKTETNTTPTTSTTDDITTTVVLTVVTSTY